MPASSGSSSSLAAGSCSSSGTARRSRPAAARCRPVQTPCSPPNESQSAASAPSLWARRRRARAPAFAIGLLEMEAEDLRVFGERVADGALEPAGVDSAGGPQPLGEAAVRRVPDEEVPEAERDLARHPGSAGRTRSFASTPPGGRNGLRCSESSSRNRVEICPRPPRARPPTAPPRAAGRDGRRAAPRATAAPRDRESSSSIETSSSTNSGLPSEDSIARRRTSSGSADVGPAGVRRAVRLPRVERLDPQRWPLRTLVEELRAARPEQENREPGESSAARSTRSRNAGSAQWRSSRWTTRGRLRARVSKQPRAAHAMSSAETEPTPRPSSLCERQRPPPALARSRPAAATSRPAPVRRTRSPGRPRPARAAPAAASR